MPRYYEKEEEEEEINCGLPPIPPYSSTSCVCSSLIHPTSNNSSSSSVHHNSFGLWLGRKSLGPASVFCCYCTYDLWLLKPPSSLLLMSSFSPRITKKQRPESGTMPNHRRALQPTTATRIKTRRRRSNCRSRSAELSEESLLLFFSTAVLYVDPPPHCLNKVWWRPLSSHAVSMQPHTHTYVSRRSFI